MNEEVNKIIDNLEGCIGMFDYLLTPVESNLLVSYIKDLEHNWNELKKWLEERCKDNMELITFRLAICRVLDKIKELEEGGNNE